MGFIKISNLIKPRLTILNKKILCNISIISRLLYLKNRWSIKIKKIYPTELRNKNSLLIHNLSKIKF
jgi:hypothetical protein